MMYDVRPIKAEEVEMMKTDAVSVWYKCRKPEIALGCHEVATVECLFHEFMHIFLHELEGFKANDKWDNIAPSVERHIFDECYYPLPYSKSLFALRVHPSKKIITP